MWRRSRARPLVGITGPTGTDDGAVGFASGLLCAAAVSKAGGIPVLLPAEGRRTEARNLAGRLDALLLSGGRQLHTRFFMEHPRPTLEETDPRRYWFEHALILAALERNMPVLGICRGMQMLNEALGGTLVRNLALDWPRALKHRQAEPANRPTHRVRLAQQSHLIAVIGQDHVRVNSFHLQAVETPGVGLKAVAWADDMVIEAVEAVRDTPFLVGVQFHPEALVQTHDRWLELFRALIAGSHRTA